MNQKIRIGCGAGFSGDKLDPSVSAMETGKDTHGKALSYALLEMEIG